MPIKRSRALATALLRPAAPMLFACLLANPAHATPLPERGLSQAAVEQRFGAPTQVRPPVGQPPITRWVYPDFTVYFEGQHALHAVSHHAPAVPAGPAPAQAAEPASAPAEARGRPAFRFDPASGQIIELDASGNDVAVEVNEEVTEEALPAGEPAATADQPVADTPAEAADTEARFRFDPVSGRIIMDEATPAGAAQEPALEEPEPEAGPDAPEESEPSSGGGFRIQW